MSKNYKYIFRHGRSFLISRILLSSVEIFCKALKVQIVIPREDRLGHQAGNIDSFLDQCLDAKKNKNLNSIFIFCQHRKNVSNLYLRHKLISSLRNIGFICIETKGFLGLLGFFFRMIDLYCIKKSFYLFRSSEFSDSGERNHKINLIPSSKSLSEIKKILEINNKKYVCIYNRDNKYLRDRFPLLNFNYHEHRNSSIDNLKKLSELFVNKFGFSVVRIGSNPEKKIEWENLSKDIIDYPFSGFRDQIFDIELISGCEFFISNGGGPEAVAIASQRKVFAINAFLYPCGFDVPRGIFIPKVIRDCKSGKVISITEMVKRGILKVLNNEQFLKAGVIIYENSENEILKAFEDYLNYKNKKLLPEDLELIEKYRLIRNKICINQKINNFVDNIIAPSFLKKYPELLH